MSSLPTYKALLFDNASYFQTFKFMWLILELYLLLEWEYSKSGRFKLLSFRFLLQCKIEVGTKYIQIELSAEPISPVIRTLPYWWPP